MPDPANFFLDKQKLCIMLLPKTCSSAVKKALLEMMGKKDARDLPIVPTNDIPPEYFTIALCRHPIDRFMSGYNNKIKRSFIETLRRVHGMTPEMSALEIAEICRDTPDETLNQHFRSQDHMCRQGDRWLPDLVVKQETIGETWPEVQQIFWDRAEMKLPALGRHNVTVNGEKASPAVEAIIRARFVKDFDTFGYK